MAIVLIVVIPLIHWKYLIDWDYLPKFLAYTLVSVFILTRALINRWSIPVPSFRFAWLWWLGYGLMMGFSLYRSINIDLGILEFSKLNLLLLLMIVLYIYHNRMAKGDTFYYFNFTVLLLVFFAVLDFYKLGRLDPDSVNFFRVDLEIRSTLANKNFLAEALVLMAPFTLASSFSKDKWRRLFSLCTLFVLVFSVLLLQSASSIISLLVFLIVFAILIYFKKKYLTATDRKIQLGKWAVLTLAIVFIGGSLLIRTSVGDTLYKKWGYAKRYAGTTSTIFKPSDEILNTNSVFDRILLLHNSIALMRESPFIGIGTSNWIIEWSKFGIVGAAHLNVGTVHFEHPHNEFLLIGSEYGLVGLVFFFIPVGGLFFCSMKAWRKSIDKTSIIKSACLIASLFSFLILMLLGFPLHRPFTVFLLAYSIAYMLSLYTNKLSIEKTRALSSTNIIVFLAFGLLFFFWGIERLNGECGLVKAMAQRSKGHYQLMYSTLSKSVSAFYQVDDYGTPLSWYMGLAKSYSGEPASALEYFTDAAEKSPYHIQVLSDLGATYLNQGKNNEAIEVLTRAVKVIPRHCESNLNLGIAYFNTGKINAAQEYVFKGACRTEVSQHAQQVILRDYITKEMDVLPEPKKEFLRTILTDSVKFDSLWLRCQEGGVILIP